MKKGMLSLFIVLICVSSIHAQNITNAEFFVDTDPGVGNGTAVSVGTAGDIVNFSVSVPTGSYNAGFHFLAVRVKDATGKWGLYDKRGFYVSPSAVNSANITAAEYFFDSDPGVGNGTSVSVGASGATVNFTAAIPTSLSTGFHFLAIRVKDANGIWGLFDKRGFYISNSTTATANIVAAEYFLDSDPGIGNGTSLSVGTSGAVVNFTASIPTSVSPGFHFLAIRVKDATGIWGLYDKRGFYVSSATANSGNITAAEYFFDADPGVGNGTSISVGASGPTVNFTASIPTSLSVGFHFLSIRVKDANGIWGLYEKRGFYISNFAANSPSITAAEYFFDADPGPGNGTALTITTPGDIVTQTFMIAEPGLTLGTHYLGIRVRDANGKWGLYEYDTLTIGNSTISCPSNVTVSTSAGECTAIINSIDPTITPPQSYTYTLTGSTTGNGSGTASGLTFNAGVTTVTYALTGSPTVNCSFTVTVNAVAPNISTQPMSQSACAGDNVTFTVVATGTNLSYQWRKNSANISGANSSSYTITNVTAGDAGNYDVIVSTTCGTNVTSATATLTVGGVSITSQPTSQTVCPGSNVTFSVGATGASLTYQWRKNTVNISGATSSSYTINNVTAGDAGSYDVIVTGSCGSVTSNAATLTLNAVTVINTQPDNQSVCPGINVTFSVGATGTGTLTYQWRKNTVNISGATSSSYTINNVAAGDAGNYDVIVTGTCGSVTSNVATLTIIPSTSITTQPTNQSSCVGGNVTFSVVATGNNLTYQWRKNTVNISGATSSSYSINGIVAGDAGNYDVVITGTCGTVTSVTVTLTISANTVINTQPASQSVCPGTSVSFTVSASGSGTLTYQWKKNGINISGATSATYTINPVTAGDAADYSVDVTSSCGTITSNNATLTVLQATIINTQPANQSVCPGGNVTFSVVANGINLSYQWRKNSVNISGATSASYTITAVVAGDAGNYDVVVTGDCGTVTSATATLMVNAVTSITTQPITQTVCPGSNVTFSVVANGTSLTYQWRKNSANISGATSSSYTINNVSAGDVADYDVVVTGACGNATSNIATLALNAVTAITTQPSSQSACAGSNVTFTVAANGTNLSYQWRKGGVNISGATSSSYTINNITVGDAANYDVFVSGTCGNVSSNVVTLSINPSPTITTQPQSQTVFVGSNVTFTVVATGSGLTYQWRKAGVDISGATSSSYTINNVAIGNAGDYDVVVSGTCSPAVTSNVAVLTVNTVTITTQPANQSACVGSNTTFNVVANGVNLTYQWQVSAGGGPFVNIPTATTSTLTLNAVTIAMNGNQYRCVVSGSLNSNVATLTVNPLPTVTLILPFDTLYLNSPALTLSAGSPSGGTYTGTGIIGNTLTPGSLALGNYTITYNYTNANGCSSSATDVFTLIPKADKVNIYPNPARDGAVNIVVSPDLVRSAAIAYNSQGQKVAEWTVTGMLTSYQFNWSAGVYIINFNKGSIKISQRLVITR